MLFFALLRFMHVLAHSDGVGTCPGLCRALSRSIEMYIRFRYSPRRLNSRLYITNVRVGKRFDEAVSGTITTRR